ncbi:hypothetical protein [Streptomyces turgidiscabies]|uniref:hypothetical protein n=1 Tax=Streptomyces turgidiscabies TaxID=85558 RepID=UPI0038F76116
MPKKPKTSQQDAAAAPAPDLLSASPAPPAPDTAGLTPQDADLDMYGNPPAGFSEVNGELDELPER